MKDLGYSYKKGWSRSILSDDPKLKYAQAVFGARMLTWLNNGNLIVNIDESIYSRSTKFNYTWLPKNKSSPVINIKWKGNVVCLFALCSDGNWISTMSHKTTDSSGFWRFLVIMKAFLEMWTRHNIDNVIIAMDNASIHSSKKTNKGIVKLGLQVEMLPPYSPTLAPVEMVFGITKNIIAKDNSLKEWNFSQVSGRNTVIEAIKAINANSVRSIWSLFIKDAYMSMIKVKEDIWILRCINMPPSLNDSEQNLENK